MTGPARVRLHGDCRVCDVVNNPLPHKAHLRAGLGQTPAPATRKVPAHVARYCDATSQDVPDWAEAV